MDISFYCGKCGQHILVDEAAKGLNAGCPNCGTTVVVPVQSVTKTANRQEPSSPASSVSNQTRHLGSVPAKDQGLGRLLAVNTVLLAVVVALLAVTAYRQQSDRKTAAPPTILRSLQSNDRNIVEQTPVDKQALNKPVSSNRTPALERVPEEKPTSNGLTTAAETVSADVWKLHGSIAYLDARAGFRDVRLGITEKELSDAVLIWKDGSDSVYVRKYERPEMPAVELKSVEYRFINGVLNAITVKLKRPDDALTLRKGLIEAYGQPTSDSSGITEWKGSRLRAQMAVLSERVEVNFWKQPSDSPKNFVPDF